MRLQEALGKNRKLADELASAFGRAKKEMVGLFQTMAEMSLPAPDFSPGSLTGEDRSGLNVPFSLDMTKANKELTAFFREAGKTLKLTADASGVYSAGQGALNRLRALYASTTLPIKTQVTTTGAASGGTSGGGGAGGINLNTMMKAATGGRFTRPQQVEIAEDGDPEYVIPVKKEGIAVPLLRQLIGELSASARESLRGESTGGTEAKGARAYAPSGSADSSAGSADLSGILADLPGLLASAAGAAVPTVTQNNSHSVQAPISINVTASGTDPEAVGRSVYDVAEQYLLRTLKGTI